MSLIIDISIHERKKENCVTRLCSPISPIVMSSPSMEEFVHYSEDKIT